MLTAPIVLLVAVGAGATGRSITREAADACIESLSEGAGSVVRMVPTAPSDAEVAADASALGAAAVVVLAWHDAAFLTTDIRVFIPSRGSRPDRWIAHTVVFGSSDLSTERGRAVGLVIASMLEESWGQVQGKDRVGSPPPPPVETPPARALAAPIVGVTEPPPSVEALGRWSLEANLTTIVDREDGVDVDTLGGAIALRRSLAVHWALRIGLGYRVGDLDGAQATTRTAIGAFGVAWTSEHLGRPHQLGFGARLDLLGTHEAIKRDIEGPSPSATEGYWSWGGDLLGQAGYGLSRETALLASGGLEEDLTAAQIVVSGRTVATISREQIVFEVGILSHF
jgi:hypothetical protein